MSGHGRNKTRQRPRHICTGNIPAVEFRRQGDWTAGMENAAKVDVDENSVDEAIEKTNMLAKGNQQRRFCGDASAKRGKPDESINIARDVRKQTQRGPALAPFVLQQECALQS
jgi:hypothetical protein